MVFGRKKKKGKGITFELKFKDINEAEVQVLEDLWEEMADIFVGRLQERSTLGQISAEITNSLLVQLGRPPLAASDVEKKKLTSLFDSAFKVDQTSFEDVFASLGSAAKQAAPTPKLQPSIPASVPTTLPTPQPTAPTPAPSPTPVITHSPLTPSSAPPVPKPYTPSSPPVTRTPVVPSPTPLTPASIPSTPTPTPVVPSVPSVQPSSALPSAAVEEDRATGIALLRKEMLKELRDLRSILDE